MICCLSLQDGAAVRVGLKTCPPDITEFILPLSVSCLPYYLLLLSLITLPTLLLYTYMYIHVSGICRAHTEKNVAIKIVFINKITNNDQFSNH